MQKWVITMRNFFERKNKKSEEKPTPDMKILPSDVRYALQYGQALLGKNEIEALVLNNFPTEAMYLTLKGLKESPEEQKSLLEKYVSSVLNKNNINNPQGNENLINDVLKERSEFSVDGHK